MSQELEGPQRLLPPFNGQHSDKLVFTYLLNGKSLGFHVFDQKYPVHSFNLTMIQWTIYGGMVLQKSSARKVTHMISIPTLSDLTLELPWDHG